MRILTATLLSLFCALCSFKLLQAQQSPPQPPVREPDAVTILVQSVASAGGANALSSIEDFSATGTITYFWGGQEASGSATVRARGKDQFSLESQLPDGKRLFIVSHGKGKAFEPDGKVTDLPFRNTFNLGIVTFPYISVAAAISDPLTSVTSAPARQVVSVTNLEPIKPLAPNVYGIRVQRHFSTDASDSLSKLTVTDYWVDTNSGLIVQVDDTMHSAMIPGREYPHEIDLGNYKRINGISVPMDVSDKVNGQLLWKLNLDTVNFNVGLSDSDFDLGSK